MVLYSEEVAGQRVFRTDVIRGCSISGPSVVGSLIRIQPGTWRRRVGLHHDCCLNVFSAARKTLFVAGRGAGVPGAPLVALLGGRIVILLVAVRGGVPGHVSRVRGWKVVLAAPRTEPAAAAGAATPAPAAAVPARLAGQVVDELDAAALALAPGSHGDVDRVKAAGAVGGPPHLYPLSHAVP